MAEPAMEVLVAGDVSLTREGIACLLSGQPEVTVRRTCTVDELPDQLDADPSPDAVVLCLPAGTDAGPQLGEVSRLVREDPEPLSLVVVSPSGDGLVRTLLESGPENVAYLIDGNVDDPRTLVRALEDANTGVVSLDSSAVDVLVGRGGHPGLAELTRREYDVLSELSRGLSNKGIADRLSITVKAVEGHITQIFRKLDLPPDGSTDRRLTAALIFLNERSQPQG